MMKKLPLGLLIVGAALPWSGCVTVKTEPIHITVDVNVRIQKELNDFFEDLDEASTVLDAEETQN